MNKTSRLRGVDATMVFPGIPSALRRLQLSRAKHRSLAGHSRMAKRITRQIPRYEVRSAMATVRIGLDNLLRSPPGWLGKRRLGLLCNPASVDGHFNHARDLLDRRFPRQRKALFAIR